MLASNTPLLLGQVCSAMVHMPERVVIAEVQAADPEKIVLGAAG